MMDVRPKMMNFVADGRDHHEEYDQDVRRLADPVVQSSMSRLKQIGQAPPPEPDEGSDDLTLHM